MGPVIVKSEGLTRIPDALKIMKKDIADVSRDQTIINYPSDHLMSPHIKTEPSEDYDHHNIDYTDVKTNILHCGSFNLNKGLSKVKRKFDFSYKSMTEQQPASVARRNARERNRVKQVNNGFATLRSHIPLSVAAALSPDSSNRTASKKLSKVETLRMAVEYIRSLQEMLDYASGEKSTASDDHFRNVRLIDSMSETSSSPPPSSIYSSESAYSTSMSVQQENYDAIRPEDEELLDAISWWQQTQ